MSEKPIIDIYAFKSIDDLCKETNDVYIKNSREKKVLFDGVSGLDKNVYNTILGSFFGPEVVEKMKINESGPLSLTNPPQFTKTSSTFLLDNILKRYQEMRKRDVFMEACFPVTLDDNMKDLTVEVKFIINDLGTF